MRPMTRRGVLSAAAWRTGEIIVSEGGSFACFLVISRLVLPPDFGAIAIATVIIALGNPLLLQGMTEAIVQRPRVSSRFLDSALLANLALGAALSIIVLLASPLLARIYGEPRLPLVLAALCPVFLLNAANAVFQAQLRRNMRFRTFALRSGISVLLGGSVGIGLALQGWGLWALVAQQICANLTSLAVLVGATQWRPRFRFRISHIQALGNFGRHTAAGSMSDFLMNRADLLIAGIFLPPAGVALLYFAKRIIFAANMLTSYSIQQVGLPVLARSLAAATSDAARRETVLNALQATILVCGPCFAGLALLGDPLTGLLGGSAWQGAGPALSFLAVAALFHCLRTMTGLLLVGSGRPSAYVPLTLIAAGASFAGMACGAPFGVHAAAASLAIAAALILPFTLNTLAIQFHLGAGDMLRAIAKAALPSILMSAIVLAAKADLLSQLPAADAVLAATGLGIVAFFAAGGVLYLREVQALLRRPALSQRPPV